MRRQEPVRPRHPLQGPTQLVTPRRVDVTVVLVVNGKDVLAHERLDSRHQLLHTASAFGQRPLTRRAEHDSDRWRALVSCVRSTLTKS